MEKVTLKTLYRDLSRRSTLIAFPNTVDLLEIEGGEFTKWEVFYSIIRDSLQNFEYYYPLNIIQKIHVVVDPNTYVSREIFNNFDQYLKGEVTEDDIQITPSSVQGISQGGFAFGMGINRSINYEGNRFYNFPFGTGVYYAQTTCRRPFPEIYDEVTKEPTDQCAVYYMQRDQDSQYSIFNDEIYLNFCKYILSIKKNVMLQGMPIELFQGLEEDYNRLEGQLQNTYMTSMPSNFFIV